MEVEFLAGRSRVMLLQTDKLNGKRYSICERELLENLKGTVHPRFSLVIEIMFKEEASLRSNLSSCPSSPCLFGAKKINPGDNVYTSPLDGYFPRVFPLPPN